MRFDILEENCIAEAAHSLPAEAGVGFPITEVSFREITDVIAPQQIGADGANGIFHFRLSLLREVHLHVIALDDECAGTSAVNDVLGLHAVRGALFFNSSCMVEAR
jgi:hypothetical protein